MDDFSEVYTLVEADDVTDEILAAVVSCVDWFPEGESMGTQEFIDRLCKDYGASRDVDGKWRGWDITSFDNPAVRKIMRHARAARRERDG